ncbi:MAG: hypothetical protein CMO74_05005 [Verrucomicrobiales bacterium]|nr:hypothetical protein [Verrucomicrobiales bacterium]
MKIRGTKGRICGFTLVELMAAIFISILVIGALYQVFSRVQEMFRVGHNQTKVLERGRAIMDMIVRDLETMCAADLGPSYENLHARDFGVEFWQEGTPYSEGNVVFSQSDRTYHVCLKNHRVAGAPNGPGTPFWRALKPEEFRTLLPYQHEYLPSEQLYSGDFFFLGHDRDWHAYGYGLYAPEGPRVPNQVAGSLYRFHSVLAGAEVVPDLLRSHNTRLGGMQYNKVADGVVHLRLRAISAMDPGRAPWHEPIFKGAHVPLYVEVEFGLLEDTVVMDLEAKAEDFAPMDPKRFPAMMEILEANLDKVHLFRQLVPIRNSRYFGFGPSKAAMTDMAVFRTQGINTRTEGKGNNFVFIIDKSGSMSREGRLSAAKQALTRTLEKLESDKNFYIYFFSDKTSGMEEGRLIQATSGNVASTSRWVNSMTPGGLTNPRDALVDAFDKLKPSTIWLLTDGRFNPYKRVKGDDGKTRQMDLPPVLEVVRNLNAAGNVRINTIGFAASERQVDASLKDIAEENDGTYTFIKTSGN